MVFGLGTTEIMLIVGLFLALIGPKGIKQIKPFFKAMYKAYLQYKKQVNVGKQEFNDITREFKKEVEEIKVEAEKELRPQLDKLRKEIEESRKKIKQQNIKSHFPPQHYKVKKETNTPKDKIKIIPIGNRLFYDFSPKKQKKVDLDSVKKVAFSGIKTSFPSNFKRYTKEKISSEDKQQSRQENKK